MAHPQLAGALAATATLLSSVPCWLKAIHAYNAANAAGFVQLFNANATASVTVGTTAPNASFGTATVTTISPDLGEGIYFPTGLVAAATTTYNGASAGSAAMTVNFVVG